MPDREHLVDVPRFIDELARADPPTVLDVRWTMIGGGRARYDAGHVPTAAFVDLDADLAGPPGQGGRHPLPDPARLQAALRAAGVRDGHPVVVYDAGDPTPTGAAARAWWILRWAGIEEVRVLDGGYAAWLAAGAPTVTERPVSTAVPAGDVTLRPGAQPVADADAAAAAARAGTLVDTRVPARYTGESEPVDPVAGHIPDALNWPFTATVDDRGRLRPVAELRAAADAAGIPDRPTVYCGSGVTAAQTALALTVAGYHPVLYVGSWSDWITDRGRPVATGETP